MMSLRFNSLYLSYAALALLVGCTDTNPPQAITEKAQTVSVAVLESQRFVISTELAGRVSALEISEVRPQVGGILLKRCFEEGSNVKAGELLYQIDPATCKADLASAEANLARAEANVLPAELKTKRFKGLVTVSAVSKQEYEDAISAYKQALAEVDVHKAAVDNARIRLEYTSVVSPISGRIGRSMITPGALVTENQETVLTTVQQLDAVYVDMTQSSTQVLHLRRALESGKLQGVDGQHAAVRLLFEDGTPYAESGMLQFTDVRVNETTGMVTLRAVFPNPRGELMPGMYVRAVLNEGVDEQALLLPQQALMRDAKGAASVYVVEENRVALRPVTLGRTHGTSWIVYDGLHSGDNVVVSGLQKIRVGSLVEIVHSEHTVASSIPSTTNTTSTTSTTSTSPTTTAQPRV